MQAKLYFSCETTYQWIYQSDMSTYMRYIENYDSKWN